MDKNKSTNGIGIGMILFLIFMTLKLTGDIDWSWWLIALPLYGPILVAILIMGIVVLISYIMYKRK